MDTGRLISECERAAKSGRIAHFRRCKAMLEVRGFLDTDGLALVADRTSAALRLLADAEVSAVVGRLRVPQIKAAASAVAAALRAGASRDFLVAAETTAASIGEIARRMAEHNRAADHRGRRRSTRHAVPKLTVRTSYREYETVDWSSCGVAISGLLDFERKVRIHVGYDAIDGGYIDGIINRIDYGSEITVIDFGRRSPTMLMLKANLFRAGIAVH